MFGVLLDANGRADQVQAHKYPIPGAKHVGVKVKVYDAEADSFRATDVVTFVGILSSEP